MEWDAGVTIRELDPFVNPDNRFGVSLQRHVFFFFGLQLLSLNLIMRRLLFI